MAHSNRKTRANGAGGTTRNQQRKTEYQKLAAATQRKGGSSSAVVSGAPKVGRTSSRTNHKPGPGKKGATHGQRAIWKAERRKEAEARKAVSDKLTPGQRIAILDKRLGVGIGATKERWRLAAMIFNPKTKVPGGPQSGPVDSPATITVKDEKKARAEKQAKKEAAAKRKS